MTERRRTSATQGREESLEDVQEDARLERLLAPLADLEPDSDLRLKNRRRLASALVERERERLRPRMAFWRRQVTLSMGTLIMIALAALAAGALAAWLILGDAATAPRLRPVSSAFGVQDAWPCALAPADEFMRLGGLAGTARPREAAPGPARGA